MKTETSTLEVTEWYEPSSEADANLIALLGIALALLVLLIVVDLVSMARDKGGW